MNIVISKRNVYKGAFFLLFIPPFVRFLTDNLGVSYAIMPFFDLLVFAMLILVLRFRIGRIEKKAWAILSSFMVIAFISIVANDGTKLSDFFYDIRPFLRMCEFFVLACCIMNVGNLERIYNITKYILYINVIVMLIQFVFFGLRQDFIGGTFGNTQGVNSIQNILCVFLFCVSIIKYFNKRILLKELFLNTITVFSIAIMAEINSLLFEIALISILGFIMCRKRKFISLRTLLLISASVVVAIVGVKIFLIYNPDRLFLFSFDNILRYIGAKDGTGVYRISRVTVFSDLGSKFFGDEIDKWIWGYGLGNCSTHTSFYDTYGYLQYNFFSTSFTFLETGFLGVAINLITIFILPFFQGIKNLKRVMDEDNRIWSKCGVILSLILFVIFFYNSSTRDIYTAFWAGLFCAIPFIASKSFARG